MSDNDLSEWTMVNRDANEKSDTTTSTLSWLPPKAHPQTERSVMKIETKERSEKKTHFGVTTRGLEKLRWVHRIIELARWSRMLRGLKSVPNKILVRQIKLWYPEMLDEIDCQLANDMETENKHGTELLVLRVERRIEAPIISKGTYIYGVDTSEDYYNENTEIALKPFISRNNYYSWTENISIDPKPFISHDNNSELKVVRLAGDSHTTSRSMYDAVKRRINSVKLFAISDLSIGYSAMFPIYFPYYGMDARKDWVIYKRPIMIRPEDSPMEFMKSPFSERSAFTLFSMYNKHISRRRLHRFKPKKLKKRYR